MEVEPTSVDAAKSSGRAKPHRDRCAIVKRAGVALEAGDDGEITAAIDVAVAELERYGPFVAGKVGVVVLGVGVGTDVLQRRNNVVGKDIRSIERHHGLGIAGLQGVLVVI